MSCFLLFILSFHCIIKQTLAFKFSPLSFDQAYAPLFGDGNLIKSSDGKSVRLMLDQRTGSGFISSDLYQYGFFSASIKLPSDYTAGVVVAFYTSNGDIFEKTHDELDFEFLGNIYGKEWKIQTNVYGNGSTSRGREERYLLWFDPSKEFHRYSILWTKKNIIFYIDDIPIREVIRNDEMGAEYPSKPMSLYATIWDGSTWATSGGKYKINYKYAPFVSEFTNFVIKGCRVDPIQQLPSTDNCTSMESELSKDNLTIISPEKRDAMRKFRMKYMTYSYCYANLRYSTPLPECVLIPSERRRFKESGRVKSINNNRRRHNKNRSRSGTNVSEDQASM